MPFVVALIVILLLLIVRNIRVVQQANAYVIERLGAYSTIWTVGLHIKIPFIERVAKVVTRSMKGILMCRPTVQVVLYAPSRSMT